MSPFPRVRRHLRRKSLSLCMALSGHAPPFQASPFSAVCAGCLLPGAPLAEDLLHFTPGLRLSESTFLCPCRYTGLFATAPETRFRPGEPEGALFSQNSALRRACNAQPGTKNRRGKPLRYREPACKPGSVPLRAAVIHPGRRLPDGSSNLPGSDWPGRPAPLFGLASNGVCLARRVATTTGGLLLHPFTLTSTAQGRLAVCFLLRFPEIALSGRYPAFCPVKPGLSSPPQCLAA